LIQLYTPIYKYGGLRSQIEEQAMSVAFNDTTYTGGEVVSGIYTDVVKPRFTGVEGLSGANSVSLTGTVTKVGDSVHVTAELFGFQFKFTVTYEGYYFDAQHNPVYVFGGGPDNLAAFAVSTDGSTLPVSSHHLIGGDIPGCFLRGTRLATPTGDVAVEDLRPGDLIATKEAGDIVFRPVRWIGHRWFRLAGTGIDVIDAYPVRIRAGAFADNVPSRDLLLTSEHCVFVEGKLVPIRMLVNHGSIVIDKSVTHYQYFHVELENHAILIAEGLETESYLDTGNRGNFSNAPVASLHTDQPLDVDEHAWQSRAIAPLTVDRETVEPIWQKLNARANLIGLAATQPNSGLLNEPDLRLVTETGVEILPVERVNQTVTFVVPASAGRIRLLSRSSRPSETVGPYLDDRRSLGVLVGDIGCDDGDTKRSITGHLTDATLRGWYPQEPASPYRWTNGNAMLPIKGASGSDRPYMLTIQVVSAGPYLARDGLRLAA
jgi:antigen 43